MLRVCDDDIEVVLIDFGLAAFTYDEKLASRRCGTPGYSPPEFFTKQNAYECKSSLHKIDVFSIGCVFFKLVTNQKVFEGHDWADVLEANKK